MVLFIPIAILLLFGITVQILGRTRFNILQTWVFTIFGSFLALTSYVVIKFTSSELFTTPFLISNDSHSFLSIIHIGNTNWIFGLLLLTLLVSTLLLDSNRLTDKNNLFAWSGALIICASGLMAIMSQSLISFLISSALLDIVLLTSYLSIQRDETQNKTAIVDFMLRSVGTLLIMFGIMVSGNLNLIVLSLGIMLRLGIFPIGLDDWVNPPMRQNLLSFFEIAVPLSVFAFISGIEIPPDPFPGENIIFALLTLLSISKIIKLITNRKEHQKHREWVELFSGLALFILLSGNGKALVPFAIAFILSGAIQSLVTQSDTALKIGISALLFGAIGFPYTPSFGIWLSSSTSMPDFYLVCYNLLLALGLISAFIFIHLKMKNEKKMEKWVAVVANISSIFLLIVSWILEFWLTPDRITLLDFLLPGLLVVLLSVIFVAQRNKKILKLKGRVLHDKNKFIPQVVTIGLRIFDLQWVTVIFSWINKVISELIRVLTLVLDGEGGLLWAFVFLILISTILVTYRFL